MWLLLIAIALSGCALAVGDRSTATVDTNTEARRLLRVEDVSVTPKDKERKNATPE